MKLFKRGQSYFCALHGIRLTVVSVNQRAAVLVCPKCNKTVCIPHKVRYVRGEKYRRERFPWHGGR
jgi:hypothetical protein